MTPGEKKSLNVFSLKSLYEAEEKYEAVPTLSSPPQKNSTERSQFSLIMKLPS